MHQAGVIVRVAARVYGFAAVPETEDGRIAAAVLGAGPGTVVAR